MGGNATSGPTGLIQLALPLEGILGYALQKVRTKERMEYAEKTTTDFACFINALTNSAERSSDRLVASQRGVKGSQIG